MPSFANKYLKYLVSRLNFFLLISIKKFEVIYMYVFLFILIVYVLSIFELLRICTVYDYAHIIINTLIIIILTFKSR